MKTTRIISFLFIFLISILVVHSQASMPNCTDSDGGLNIWQKGTTHQEGARPYTDYCTDGRPDEFYCDNTLGLGDTLSVCPAGSICEDGACVRTTSEINDTLSIGPVYYITSEDILLSSINNTGISDLDLNSLQIKFEVEGGMNYTDRVPDYFGYSYSTDEFPSLVNWTTSLGAGRKIPLEYKAPKSYSSAMPMFSGKSCGKNIIVSISPKDDLNKYVALKIVNLTCMEKRPVNPVERGFFGKIAEWFRRLFS